MTRWRNLAVATLALLGACAPRGARVPTVPVVVIRPDTPSTAPVRPAPRDTIVLPPGAPDTAMFPEALLAPAVRVGIAVDTDALDVTSADSFAVWMAGQEIGRVPGGDTVRFRDQGATVSMESRGARGSAMSPPRRIGGAGLRPPLSIRTFSPQGMLSARGARYRGELIVQNGPGGGLTLVNRLDMESYLLGVVPREIGAVQADVYEAVKAQAVAARTYAVTYMGRRADQGFDVLATVEDQVYGGAGAENELVTRAVRETAGEILVYGGRPITAYYHSTCAGYTAAIEEVWNASPVPYLVAVRDVDPRTGEAYDRASSRFRWTERWTEDQLVTVLNRTLADSLRGRRIGRVDDVRILDRTPSGRVRAMRISTDAGSFTVGRDRVRWILTPARGGTLNSSKFDVSVSRSGSRVSELVVEGGGWGHGIGMCQVGAMGRARAGQDYRQILGAYYPGTQIQDQY